MMDNSTRSNQFEFPFKLHRLLDDAASEGNAHIVSWTSDGKAFQVHSKREFERNIAPRYFTSLTVPKFRSFQRQLAIYGFHFKRDPSISICGVYCHPLFVRGQPGLCNGMKREKFKDKGGKTTNKTGSSETGRRLKKESISAGSNENAESNAAFLGLGFAVPKCFHRATETQKQIALGPSASTLKLDPDDDLLQFAVSANEFLARSKATSQQDGTIDTGALGDTTTIKHSQERVFHHNEIAKYAHFWSPPDGTHGDGSA